MKIVKCKRDTIHINDVDEDKHIVVGVHKNDKPVILTREDFGCGCFSFRDLKSSFTNGNGWSDYDTLKEAISSDISSDRFKIEVFENKDWKGALQWLIDNA